MIFSSMIGTSFLGKGYHLRGGIGRWGEWCFDLSITATKALNSCCNSIGGAKPLSFAIFPWNRFAWDDAVFKRFICSWRYSDVIIYSANLGLISGLNLSNAALLTIWNFSPTGTVQQRPTVPEQEISTSPACGTTLFAMRSYSSWSI